MFRDVLGMKIAVRRGGGFGDVLLTTPILKALKQKYPDSELTFVTDQSGYTVLKGLPYIDDYLLYKGLYNVQHLKLEGFDLEFSLMYEKRPNCHILDAYASQADVALIDKKPEIALLQSHYDTAEQWMDFEQMKEKDLLIGIHRGPTWPCRAWHPLKFKAVADYLKEKYHAVIAEFSGEPGFGMDLGIDLTGKTSIRQTAAILKRCSLLICIDSFLLHLASAVETPTVAIFGCTDPLYRLPFNDISIGVQTSGDCRSCYHDGKYKTCCTCYRDRIYCMEEVSVEDVTSAADILLERFNIIS
jgi:ADP-heptose:LPS heptosyltransferase